MPSLAFFHICWAPLKAGGKCWAAPQALRAADFLADEAVHVLTNALQSLYGTTYIDSNNYFVEQLEIFLACTSSFVAGQLCGAIISSPYFKHRQPFFIIVVKVVIHFRQYFHCSCQVSKPSSVLDSPPKITWGMCFLDFFRKISEWARLAVFDISCDFGQKRWFSDDSHTLVNIYAYCVRKISSCLHNSSKDFSQMVRSY